MMGFRAGLMQPSTSCSAWRATLRRLVFEAAVGRWLVRLEERVQPRSEPKGVA